MSEYDSITRGPARLAMMLLRINGFDFDLDNPKKNYPKLIVIRYGQVIRPGKRFPMMKAVLRESGISLWHGELGTCIWLAAFEKYPEVK